MTLLIGPILRSERTTLTNFGPYLLSLAREWYLFPHLIDRGAGCVLEDWGVIGGFA